MRLCSCACLAPFSSFRLRPCASYGSQNQNVTGLIELGTYSYTSQLAYRIYCNCLEPSLAVASPPIHIAFKICLFCLIRFSHGFSLPCPDYSRYRFHTSIYLYMVSSYSRTVRELQGQGTPRYAAPPRAAPVAFCRLSSKEEMAVRRIEAGTIHRRRPSPIVDTIPSRVDQRQLSCRGRTLGFTRPR